MRAQNQEEIGKVLSGLLAIDMDVSFDYDSLKRILTAGYADMLPLKRFASITYPANFDREFASALAARMLMEPQEVNYGWSDILEDLPLSWKFPFVALFIIPKSTGVFFDEEDEPLETFPTDKYVLSLLFAFGFSIIATRESAARLDYWIFAASECPDAWMLFARDLEKCLDHIPDENLALILLLLRKHPQYLEELSPDLFARIEARASLLPGNLLLDRDAVMRNEQDEDE